MTLHKTYLTTNPSSGGIIKLAVMAVGGQGGGVLTGWIEALARANGYACQATSVAGVAQRTGATVYYVEMAPKTTKRPIFSLMPAAGDVDIVIAAEMMEAGRAIMRGFVTPDRTTLISSTHRALAVSEKMVPGDGITSSEEVLAAAEIATQQFIAADFDALAIAQGSVISASLFGALAASGALPFTSAAFEDAIRTGGKGTEASLRAYDSGFAAAQGNTLAPTLAAKPADTKAQGPALLLAQWQGLERRAAELPVSVAQMALLGLRKVVEFQDTAYGGVYLNYVTKIVVQDRAPFDLSREAAKYIANAMAYDDVIRVADLKTRAGRTKRIAAEMGVTEQNVMQLTEFLHPRAEEVVGLLPAALGARIDSSQILMSRINRWFSKGRRMRTDGIVAYLMLYVLGGMIRRRPGTLRHSREVAHLERWLGIALGYLPQNYGLAVEVIRCRRLIKGYSDTHARGMSKFDRVLEGIVLVAARQDAADWARRLREAALMDEDGKALDGALATVKSFA